MVGQKARGCGIINFTEPLAAYKILKRNAGGGVFFFKEKLMRPHAHARQRRTCEEKSKTLNCLLL